MGRRGVREDMLFHDYSQEELNLEYAGPFEEPTDTSHYFVLCDRIGWLFRLFVFKNKLHALKFWQRGLPSLRSGEGAARAAQCVKAIVMKRSDRGIAGLRELCDDLGDGVWEAPLTYGYWSDFIGNALCHLWDFWEQHVDGLKQERELPLDAGRWGAFDFADTDEEISDSLLQELESLLDLDVEEAPDSMDTEEDMPGGVRQDRVQLLGPGAEGALTTRMDAVNP